MKRTFAGIPVEPDIATAIEEFQEPESGVRWVPSHNLHITVEFLGASADEQLHELAGRLHDIDGPAFAMHAVNLSALPGLRRARVVALMLDPTDAFETLYRAVRNAAEEVGFRLKPPRVSPHVTTARLRHPDRSWLREYLSRLRPAVADLPPLRVQKISLYNSVLHPSGAEYSVLESIALQPSL